jgi:hypothetical protein
LLPKPKSKRTDLIRHNNRDPVTGKLIGGATGKGWLPGQRGTPPEMAKHSSDHRMFCSWLRMWLLEQDWVRDGADGRKVRKEVRLKTIITNLADSKPEILLYYAYGRPLERHEVTGEDGNPIEFIVRVGPAEMP